MNRRHVNAAITAGLALTMTVGSVPPQAFAEMMQGDTTQVVAEQSDATGAAATSADTGQATSEDQAVDKIASLAEQPNFMLLRVPTLRCPRPWRQPTRAVPPSRKTSPGS